MTKKEKVEFIKTSWGLKNNDELGLRLGMCRKTLSVYMNKGSRKVDILLNLVIENIKLKEEIKCNSK